MKRSIQYIAFTIVFLISALFGIDSFAAGAECGSCEPIFCPGGCGETVPFPQAAESCHSDTCGTEPGDNACCHNAGTCCLVCQPGDCGGGGGGYCGVAPPPPLLWYQFGPTEDVNNVFYFWDNVNIPCGWGDAWTPSSCFMYKVPEENKGQIYYFTDDVKSVTVTVFQRIRPYYDGEHHDTWGHVCNGVWDGCGWFVNARADGETIMGTTLINHSCNENASRKHTISLSLEGRNQVEVYAKSVLFTNGERISGYGYPARFIRSRELPFTVTLFNENSSTYNQCTSTTDFLDNIEVSIYDTNNTFLKSATTNENGVADFEIYPQTSGKLIACITSDIYDITCTNDPLYEGLVGKCAEINFTDSLEYYNAEDHEIYLGLKALIIHPWSASIGGDIFANTIFINPAENPINFYSAIINSIDSISGYAFTNDIIALSDDEIYEDSGGAATNFSNTVYPHNSIHLDKFRFTPATSSTPEEWPSGNSFEGQETYEISVEEAKDKFNSALTYSVSGDGVAVVYVTGTDETFEINGPVTASSGRIVLVVEGQTFISKDIGYSDTTEFGKNSTPNIMAGIISQGDIEFESEGTDPGSDIPIIVQAPLVSKNGIVFDRDLGPLNINYPATSAKYYAKFLYELTKLERDQGYLNDTGFQKFDVQYIFQD